MLLGRVIDHLHPELSLLTGFDLLLSLLARGPRFLARFAAEFRDQPGIAFRQQFRPQLSLPLRCMFSITCF